jgi:hypothetical protein
MNSKNHGEYEDVLCRLCDGPLSEQFQIELLGRHTVKYYKCMECSSLQTEPPYWLGEAYDENLSLLDTGAAQRNMHNLAACYLVARMFKLRNVIDFGGGDGLLCRLLRDYQINCYVSDKYARITYAQAYRQPDFEKPDLMLSFEVLEHLANPKTDLGSLFESSPKGILVSTMLYADQDRNWWYLAADSGQHVFFYSQQSIQKIAQKYAYEAIISGGYVLFVKPKLLSPLKRMLVSVLLKGKALGLLRACMQILPTPGIWSDHQALKDKS